MHHIESSAGTKCRSRRAHDILQIAENLMAGNRLGKIGIFQPVAVVHVRRVRRYHIKGCLLKQRRNLLDIALHDRNLLFQPVERHTPGCHLRHLRLDLQTCKMASFRLCLQKNRDNTSSRSQIKRFLARLHRCKPGQKHRVHAKTEPVRLLDDPVSVPLQFIDPLALFNYHPASTFLPFSPVPPALSAPHR